MILKYCKIDFTDKNKFFMFKDLSFGIQYNKYRDQVKEKLNITSEKV